MMGLEYLAASRDGGEDAVGDTAGLHGCEKVIDDFVPGAPGDEGMDAAISDDFDIALTWGAPTRLAGRSAFMSLLKNGELRSPSGSRLTVKLMRRKLPRKSG